MNDATLAAQHVALVRWGLAAMLASIGYMISVAYDLPLFNYYPMVGEWSWRAPTDAATLAAMGPRIAFFGWKTAGLLAAPLAWLLPARWLVRLPASSGVIGIALICTGMLIYESRWFRM